MDLSISHISFANFRSYERFDLDGIGPLTVLVGPNAVGKTNVVEGSCSRRSRRFGTRPSSSLCAWAPLSPA